MTQKFLILQPEKILFFSQLAISFIPKPQMKDLQATGEAFSPQHPAL
jgi:hypothetical protein